VPPRQAGCPRHVFPNYAEKQSFLAPLRYSIEALLDLKLPKVSGSEVLRQMKEDPRTRALPVVVLTSSREDRDVVESYKLGVNSCVVKPSAATFINHRDARITPAGNTALKIESAVECPPRALPASQRCLLSFCP
jgi:CheY-like chemotaxis protein